MNYSHAVLINVDSQLKDTHENAIDEDAKDDDVISEDATGTETTTKPQDTIFVSYIRKRKPKNNLAKPNQSIKSEHDALNNSEQSEESSKSTNEEVIGNSSIGSSTNDDLSNVTEKPSISPQKSSYSNHQTKVKVFIRFYMF